MAYAFSKNFVVWYAKKCAFAYGKKGIRVVSLSSRADCHRHGQSGEGGGRFLIPLTAEERMGKPEELVLPWPRWR